MPEDNRVITIEGVDTGASFQILTISDLLEIGHRSSACLSFLEFEQLLELQQIVKATKSL